MRLIEDTKGELQRQCFEILERDLDGSLVLDDNFCKCVGHILNNLDWDKFRANDVACICNITVTAMYKLKNGECERLSQKSIISIVSAMFAGKHLGFKS